MKFIIAGIGSRDISSKAFAEIEELAQKSINCFINEMKLDFWIRSGHARGSDYAFETAAKDRCIVYLPWKDFGKKDKLKLSTKNYILWNEIDRTVRETALKSVLKFHPYPYNLSPGQEKCLARDYFQIFGSSLESDPVDAVVCWAIPKNDYEVCGGTGQAVRIARASKIPIFNLFSHSPDEILENLKQIASQKINA